MKVLDFRNSNFIGSEKIKISEEYYSKKTNLDYDISYLIYRLFPEEIFGAS